jgi:hypothetical protein
MTATTKFLVLLTAMEKKKKKKKVCLSLIFSTIKNTHTHTDLWIGKIVGNFSVWCSQVGNDVNRSKLYSGRN